MADDPLAEFGMDDIAEAGFGNISSSSGGSSEHGQDERLNMISEIPVRLTAELGETTVTIKDLLQFGPGSVIELQRLAGEPAQLFVNGVLVGKGDVVVVNENYGLRLTDLVSSEDRLRGLTR